MCNQHSSNDTVYFAEILMAVVSTDDEISSNG